MLSIPHTAPRCRGRSGLRLSTAVVGADLVTRSQCNPQRHSAPDTFAQDLAALIHSLRAAGTRGRQFAGVGRGGELKDSDEGDGGINGTFKSMTGLLIGYARVSTKDQDLTAQKNALVALGVTPEKTLTDQGLTGANRARPGLREASAACWAGDTLVWMP